jgi:CRISPR-associated protein Cmr4
MSRMYWLHALSPLHVGIGRGLGFIDLPIMREKITDWPLVPGSGVKGVMADHFGATQNERKTNEELKAAFGMSGTPEESNAGALVYTDARIVCLPVRSLYGTFAWVTSGLVLHRLLRELEEAGSGADSEADLDVPADPAEGSILLPDDPASVLADNNHKVFFEDLDFQRVACEKTAKWAEKLAGWVFSDDTNWQTLFRQRFAIVPNDTFDFLCETAVQVDARVRIDDDQKTVAAGALWYEEALPVETILAGLVWCDRVFVNQVNAATLLANYCEEPLALQIGGKATVGRGRVNCAFTGGV